MAHATFDIPSSQNITRTTLANGITLLVYENWSAQSVNLYGTLRAGKLYEAPDTPELASMTATMLMRGTQTHDFTALHEALESIGADLELTASVHNVVITGKALAEDLQVLLTLLSDMLRAPTFPEVWLTQLKAQLQTSINYALQDTRYMAERTFRDALYPPTHPQHSPLDRTLAYLPQVTREDLQAFHARCYGAQGMILAIVGAVKTQEAVALVERTLGDWHNPAQDAPRVAPVVTPPETTRRLFTPIAGKTQNDISMGTLGPTRRDPAYTACMLANSILGEFGMMGRVGHVIREEAGMAYYAYTRLEGGESQGTWQLNAGVAPHNVDQAITLARDEFARLTQELVDEEELADNQSYFVGRLPLRLENNNGIASVLEAMERYGLGLDYLRDYRDIIYSVTREDVRAAAQMYLNPDALIISVAGSEGA